MAAEAERGVSDIDPEHARSRGIEVEDAADVLCKDSKLSSLELALDRSEIIAQGRWARRDCAHTKKGSRPPRARSEVRQRSLSRGHPQAQILIPNPTQGSETPARADIHLQMLRPIGRRLMAAEAERGVSDIDPEHARSRGIEVEDATDVEGQVRRIDQTTFWRWKDSDAHDARRDEAVGEMHQSRPYLPEQADPLAAPAEAGADERLRHSAAGRVLAREHRHVSVERDASNELIREPAAGSGSGLTRVAKHQSRVVRADIHV